ncbi:basic proline-rich protein-like [Macaca thibetana thibetana]|uniref:basic proline-rich protein-like n=1 Tax=Macaca thibetana thibetana TaxID=257877 RepID=UPI0021BC552F|nr:basic proline-rich protein-like [Macaca thibetana thibetana]
MTHNGLFRPTPYLTAVSADESTASQQPPLAQLHHYNGLFRPSSCLPVFSLGPELSQVDLTRPSSCLSLPSQGPAFASWPPSKTQLLFYSGLMRPIFAQLLPPGDFYRLRFYLWLCLEALAVASPAARPPQPDCGLPRPELLLTFGSCAGPRSGLPVATLGPAHSSQGTAFPGPAFAFWRPLQAPNFLRPAPPGPVAASRPPVQAQPLLLPAAAAGPAPASRQSLWARLRPSSHSAAFVGPKRPEAGPHGGLSSPGSCRPTASPRPSLPAPSVSRPSSSSLRPLQAHAGVESASPGLAPAPGGPCGPNSSPSRPPPDQLLPLRGLSSCQNSSVQPLQAQLLLPATGLLCPSPGHASGRPPQAQDLTSIRPRQAQPPAAQRLPQAQHLPPSGLSTPSSRLTAASPGQSSSCLSAAPPAPAPATEWPR